MGLEPAISIVTACRNSAGVLGGCIASVSAQETPREHLLVDCESRDGTADIVASSRAAIPPGSSLSFVSEPDEGPYDAMNKGIALANGGVIGILNADDEYADSMVLTGVLAAMNGAGADACYGDLVFVGPGGRVTRYWKAGPYHPDRFLAGWMPPHPAFFVRRGIYRELGLFRKDLGSAADYELMLRFLFANRVSCVYLPRVVVRMRLGGISTRSVSARMRAHRNDRLAWKVNGLKPKPWTLPLKPLRKLPQWFLRPPRQMPTNRAPAG